MLILLGAFDGDGVGETGTNGVLVGDGVRVTDGDIVGVILGVLVGDGVLDGVGATGELAGTKSEAANRGNPALIF